MLTVEAALSRILAAVPAGTLERVPLIESYGRLLGESIDAPVDLPPWPNSAMDGYAVRAADAPGALRVNETIAAGSVPTCCVVAGTASRIMTGAPMPEGADSVVMVEDTESTGGDVFIRVAARFGQHVRGRGSDVTVGTRLLEPGQRLGAGAVGLLASLGLTSVAVAARPRVVILSTGDEVAPAGKPLGPGQIYGSNTAALVGLVLAAGGAPLDHGNVPDDPEALRARFTAAAAAGDLVVSTGGVSVGDFTT